MLLNNCEFYMKNKFYWFIGNKKNYEIYYQELLDRDDISFIAKEDVFGGSILSKIFRFVFSQRVNSKVHIPFKKFFFHCLLSKYNITNVSDIVLIFHEGWFDKAIVDLLKKRYHNIKTVIYFDDTVATYAKSIPSLNPVKLKEMFNFVLTYNPEDAKKYGYIKVNACFSKLDIACDANLKSDICFIGQPKDRYELLRSIQDYIGKKCKTNFIVVGDSSRNDDGIKIAKEYINYEKYLQNEISSNCILEILKGDTGGATFRCWEAVYYNKKLLTNWKGLTSFDYYDPKYMRYFEQVKDIDIDFIKSDIDVDYHYKGDNSPSMFIEYIESLISEENLR